MTKIEFYAEADHERVAIHAAVGNDLDHLCRTSELISVLLREGETEEEAAVRALQNLFDWSDLAESGEVDDLRDEFNNHTHGGPSQ